MPKPSFDDKKTVKPLINMHTHIFPSKIEEKAVDAIGQFYGIPMENKGTSEYLLEDGAKIGVTKYLVCSTATTAHQVKSIDDFVAAEVQKHPEFIGFGSLHPDFEDPAAEIDRMISLGLKGIKLHPDFQKFNIDDESAFPIYEAAEGRLPILFHTGDDRYDFSDPRRLNRVLERFPKLIAIAAHLGGYRDWDTAKVNYGHPRVYIDTSSSLMFVPPEKAVNIIRAHGVSHVFFGTDSPMWNHVDEFARFNALELTESERSMILYENAVNFFDQFTQRGPSSASVKH
ncbi:MAG: amidohydrolase [Clostridia bacterium]|nr:amidohydrolase [Clostridia bacterium]